MTTTLRGTDANADVFEDSHTGRMTNLVQVRFVVERLADGSYRATCPELGARVDAATLPALESSLSRYAQALLAVPGAPSVPAIVRRVFPPTRESA